MVLVIMICFFSDTNSYSFGRKAHMSRFFGFFCGKMVIVIYSMLAIAIKDLALSWNIIKLVIGKRWFGLQLTSPKKLPVSRL